MSIADWYEATELRRRFSAGESGIGAWYGAKEREAARLAEKLRQARLRGEPADEIQRLERALEAARYVGD